MPHIHTAPNQHDHTVTMFIVRYVGGEPRLLLHLHRKFKMLMPPGGHIELDETPWAAVAHDLSEETGYSLGDLKLWQPKTRLRKARGTVVHPQPFASNTHAVNSQHYHTDLDYLFITEAEPPRAPNEGESTDLRWLSRADIAALSDAQIFTNVKDFCLYIFDELLASDAWEAVPAGGYDTGKLTKAETR